MQPCAYAHERHRSWSGPYLRAAALLEQDTAIILADNGVHRPDELLFEHFARVRIEDGDRERYFDGLRNLMRKRVHGVVMEDLEHGDPFVHELVSVVVAVLVGLERHRA